MKNFFRTFDWEVAWLTTRLLLFIIGMAAVVSFVLTLHGFYLFVFLPLGFSAWLVTYLFFNEMRKRGRAYESVRYPSR